MYTVEPPEMGCNGRKVFSSLPVSDGLVAVAALARHHCGCPGNFGGCDNIINSLPDVI